MLRGLETLAQLIDVFHVAPDVRQISFVPVFVQDAPRFTYRGLLLDSGRHFLPVPFIKATIGKTTLLLPTPSLFCPSRAEHVPTARRHGLQQAELAALAHRGRLLVPLRLRRLPPALA